MSIRSFKRARAKRDIKQARRAAVLARRSVVAAGGVLAVMAGSAEAATLTVTNTNDSGAGSLRAALTTANGDPSADTIVFQSGLTGAIDLTTGPLPISGTHGITIQGPGANLLTISGGAAQQIFAITSPRSDTTHNEINGLTLTNGKASGTGTLGHGGAVNWTPAAGTSQTPQPLHLDNDIISGSTAVEPGGGVYSKGPLSLSNTTVSTNQAVDGGGIALENAGATLTHSVISGNTATGSGGGIEISQYAYAPSDHNAQNGLTLISSTVTGNHATASGTSRAYGGGIACYEAALTLIGSSVTANTVSNTGTGPATGGGIFSFAKYGTTIAASTISGNTATVADPTAVASGGGLTLGAAFIPPALLGAVRKYAPAVVQNSTISSNQAAQGAGIEVANLAPGSRATIDHSTVSGNTGGANSLGGGIGIYGNVASPFLVRDSTVSGNSAATGGAVAIGSPKHAQLFPSLSHADGSVTFDNSTISGNTATAHAGGIYLGDYQVGGTGPKLSGTIVLGSTVVSGNKLGTVGEDLERVSDSTSGGFSADFSLVQNTGTAPVSGNQLITGVDPLLGPLAPNGGPTQTMKPAANSPLIDQGHVFSHLSSDQRGEARTALTGIVDPPGGDGTDIGAVELAANQVIVPPPFTVNILSTLRPPGTPLGTGKPLLIGSQTPVSCAVRTGTLSSCAVVLRYHGKIVGQGNAGGGRAASRLSTTVVPTALGLKALSGSPLGLDVQATAFGPASGGQVTGTVHLLGGPSITLKLVGRSKTLSSAVKSQLGRAAALLSGVRQVTCTAYSDAGPKRGAGDKALTTSQAKAACSTLKSKGLRTKFKAVGAGHSHEIASDRTARGRAANRRLVLTFRF